MKRDLLFFVAGLTFGIAAGFFLFRALAPDRTNVTSGVAEMTGSSIGLEEQPPRRELDQGEVERLEAKTEAEPDNAEPQAQLGQLYMEAGRYEEAITWLERSLELEPKDLHVRNHLALCYLNAGKLEDAVATYEGSLRIDPNDPPSLLGLGRIKLYLQRDIQGGLAMWQRLVEVAPSSNEATGVREELEALKSAHASN
jgi:tetratricopeptide (TPR) repeat protein